MKQFRWLSAGEIPQTLDLRVRDWVLATAESADAGCVTIIHASIIGKLGLPELLRLTRVDERRFMLVIGVPFDDRGPLLAAGFGEALDDEISLDELDARAQRTACRANLLPRRRSLATLELDLLTREAYYRGKPLNLHPREFELLWRLSDNPDEPVSKQTLFKDIWRLGHMPESNSIAVQMSRLRSKLGTAGLDGLVETVTGGYLMRRSVLEPARSLWSHGQQLGAA
jgi:hypothetical protein